MKEEIVMPAWQIASENTEIKIFNFFPSLLSTIYLAFILLYQVAWAYINVFNLKDMFFSVVVNFVHAGYFIESVAGFLIFFILFVIITPIAEGGLVSIIDRLHHTNEKNTEGIGNRKTIGF